MNSSDKHESAQTMCDLKEAIASMVAVSEDERETIISKFPEPTGLGTDGTCWSDTEHMTYCLDVMRHGKRLLEQKNKHGFMK